MTSLGRPWWVEICNRKAATCPCRAFSTFFKTAVGPRVDDAPVADPLFRPTLPPTLQAARAAAPSVLPTASSGILKVNRLGRSEAKQGPPTPGRALKTGAKKKTVPAQAARPRPPGRRPGRPHSTHRARTVRPCQARACAFPCASRVIIMPFQRWEAGGRVWHAKRAWRPPQRPARAARARPPRASWSDRGPPLCFTPSLQGGAGHLAPV